MNQPRALITGAGARLGRAMALELARQGCDVAVHYATSEDGASETVGNIQSMGRKAVALQADLLDMEQVEVLVPRAAKALGGPLSLLVNNASIFEYDTLTSATQQSWDRHMSSNLRAPFFLMQSFAAQASRAVIDDNGESLPQALVVNMLDQRVQKPTPEFMTYSLAKNALWTLTRTGAQALAPHVRVNGIAPGTTLIGARQTQAHFDGQRSASLLQRGANVEDITAALAFFLNAPAVTGQMIAVDGGQHLAWQTPDIRGVEDH
ncbi:NAD(P)-dependent dehydrogenase, short-chain alcohol dehydrogenase family [Aliiroseovarius sediminilitoris]|uniref:NAD(P)-dependent dehydrogenase, short-chain alcohol dehydrogenase family n=1 Tax=Aliiroseovarius sediminilitoris TaxID=1173584 RepID=A0A1I0NBB4_9RHOB|nr:SDR family oxidoreductase [Aliiroseovarius sediminilitoris]SEV98239.1 NAD(P)-dependent dehydrogenase, short-chain alcohol dehydrogenase family [Aliiroseovarius sediminilitoris]